MKQCCYCFVFLLVLALAGPMPGWAAKEAGAAKVDKPQASSPPAVVEGEIEIEKKPQEPCPPETAKEDECPSTFGPIITDTAIPIDKGRFAVQPTFGLGFVTNSLTQSWRRVSAGGNFKTYKYGLEIYLWPDK